jgi:hypothetical protein
MKTMKTFLLLAGIAISFSVTQAQITSKLTNTADYKPAAQKVVLPVDKSRELAKMQRKQRASERKMIRREAKLNRKIGELMLRMTGGYAYFSAP